MRILTTFFLTLIAARAGEVLQVTWATRHAAAPVQLRPPAADFLPIFRAAIQAAPESSIVPLALSQPAWLGLTSEQTERLKPLVAERYRLMDQSPSYSKAASALPYCFSQAKPATGFASLYVPDDAATNTPVIVFLHGYGGSFLWYQHYLSESFPNHIIICPAYGISTATIPQAYVAESVAAASKKIGRPISTPCLVGLSAGGFGACRLDVAAPHAYSPMICLAAYPPDETLSKFAPEAQVRFLSGALEPFAASGDLQRRITRIRRTCSAVEQASIPGADHFFLLTHAEQAVQQLRRWVPAAGSAPSP